MSRDRSLYESPLETFITLGSISSVVVRVLHVDDDVVFLRTAKQFLEKNPCLDVDSAHSVTEAIAKVSQKDYAVVISDFNMPHKNGLQFLSELRASGNTTPFVMLTCKEKAEVVVKALNSGVFRYVEKDGDCKKAYMEILSAIQSASNVCQFHEWFKQIFEGQMNGVVIVDQTTHKIVEANAAALNMIGASKQQLIGQPCNLFTCQTDKDKSLFAETANPAQESGALLIKLNSKKIPVVKFESKATIAGKEYVIVSFFDSSDSSFREKALRELCQRYRVSFKENPEAAAFCDPNFRVTEVNSHFTLLFGCSPESVVGKDVTEVLALQNIKHEIPLMKQKLSEGKTEHYMTWKKIDQLAVHLSLSGAPVTFNDRLIGYVIVYRNINDIVLANEELSRLLDEQNSLFRKTSLLNEKLSVTGSLSRHDVRNKLTGLLGNAYLAKRRAEGNTEVTNYLIQIEEIARNIARILDFAKTYELLGTQELTRINVGKTVDDAVSLFADLKDVRVTHECGDFEVLADSLLMELFHNLIDNSFKYAQKMTHINVYRRYLEDGSTELIYEDDGMGIEPEMKARLFQKGFGKGTGLGLYLIKRICEMYGWTISERGEYGKGVRFVMKLN